MRSEEQLFELSLAILAPRIVLEDIVNETEETKSLTSLTSQEYVRKIEDFVFAKKIDHLKFKNFLERNYILYYEEDPQIQNLTNKEIDRIFEYILIEKGNYLLEINGFI